MFPFQQYPAETQLVIDFMQMASAISRHVQDNLLQHSFTKDDRSPVTIGDFTIQAMLMALLLERFPGDLLVGEESSETLSKEKGQVTLKQMCDLLKPYFPHVSIPLICSWLDHGKTEQAERFWTLDPIDGTKGFIRGDQYAIALALVEGPEAKVGALGSPNMDQLNPLTRGKRGTLSMAVLGEGAWSCKLNDMTQFDRLQVSACTDIRQAVLLRSFETMHTDTGRTAQLISNLRITAPALHLDSLTKHALLAAGTGEIMVRFPSSPRSAYQQKIWDYAPGVLMIQEAGGQVSDLDGKPYDFSTGRTLSKNRGMVASNGLLHAQVLETLKTLR